ncbi:hypothetical protein CCC_00523 [Paramagnetospirillum magnetotacticum MS-1]|uniref:DUF1311 domain-containing protein n=1 Tax=Paramagnetospirillum magnetotacticum MS-1 TaxID=272627 RepID=A0A0C2U7L3_PARME|nr:hypothetical protein [Paramagnetospirillum magnetotacticum]KIL97462.1 hypothetical protein CCC_00523 [Paramagnetospirillum magnetotacticum MS-1]
MKAVGWVAALGLVTALGAEAAPQAVEYKGRKIQIGAGEQASECVALLRKAIDMTAELAPKQRALSAEVKDLRCQPISADKQTNAVVDNTIGIYTMQSPDIPGGYIRFPLKPGSLSAAEVVISLVGNGQYAKWHQAYLAAKSQGDASARRYHAILTKSDQKILSAAECELLDHRRAAVKALDLGERRLASINRESSLRGCP